MLSLPSRDLSLINWKIDKKILPELIQQEEFFKLLDCTLTRFCSFFFGGLQGFYPVFDGCARTECTDG
jgi:hypothetical protein